MTLRLGLRLAVAGGRVALLRLVVTALGVAVGVLLLLLSLSGQSATQGRAERGGWQSADADTHRSAPDEALFLSVTDYHQGRRMVRAYVAALGPNPPVPPGLERLPRPGEVAVSPALRELLASTPDDQLDDRYPGRITATIGDAGLAHPDQAVALVGRTPEQLREVSSQALQVVRGFDSLPSGYTFDLGVRVVLLAISVLLLLPVVVFVVVATRVGAAARQQRLAAIRLVGATRRQVAVVAAVETGLAAAVGTLLGWVGYEVARRIVAATATFQGGRFFLDDVVVGPWLLLLVVVGLPVLAMLTTIASLRHVEAGPLALTRRADRPAPSAWRVLPFVVGAGGQLAAVPLRGIVDDALLDNLTPLFVVSTFLGFVAMGPWLCMLAGRGLARVSRRVPGLLAARRIAADPYATFRAVSGVVLAAFSVTYMASVVDPSEDRPYNDGSGLLRPGVVEVSTGSVPEAQIAPLLEDGAVALRFDFGESGDRVESCRQFAQVVSGPCPGELRPEDADLYISRVYIPTAGTPAAENRARTQAAQLVPNAIIHVQEDRKDTDALYTRSLGQLVRLGLQFVLVVAACSLTVGMLAGLIERRRPFALLRATGLRLGELRQVVFLETAAAMLVTAVVGVGLGVASSWALSVFGDFPWAWPHAGVFAVVGIGVLASLVISTLTLPLLSAATRYDAIRYE